MTSEQHLLPCKQCGLKYQCICEEIPHAETDWHLILLTHPNETNRDTNTGKLLAKTLPNSLVCLWDRLTPPAGLIEKIESDQFEPYVLFPSDESLAFDKAAVAASSAKPKLFILLDGTWQEARKMYRKSVWLKQIPALHLNSNHLSAYQLRRNQKAGNLCTYEIGIELVKYLNKSYPHNQLTDFFNYYLSVFHADKSGHKYK